jgi:uncharacterized protein (DUF2252 family)
VWKRIEAFNRGRRPELVARKYRAMARDPFVFFRGTAHLFWEDWESMGGKTLDHAPLAWCCGDLHLENFGSYRGDNGLAYFDLNDFDEAALAPATRDTVRFLTSACLAAQSLGLTIPTVRRLEASFLDGYAEALGRGKARWIERSIATGWIRDLLRSVENRTQRELLEERTIVRGDRRRLRIDEKRTFTLTAAERRRVAQSIAKFAARQSESRFYRVLDVVGRIAGTGSLGVPRYAVLIRGDGAGDERILDVKAARPSALAIHLKPLLARRQPSKRNQAERVIEVQQRMQAIPPDLLSTLTIGATPFVVRELQPMADRLDLAAWDGRVGKLCRAVAAMGELTAWSQLRGASQGGADSVDALISFARSTPNRRRLLAFARNYAKRAQADWEDFRECLAAKADRDS